MKKKRFILYGNVHFSSIQPLRKSSARNEIQFGLAHNYFMVTIKQKSLRLEKKLSTLTFFTPEAISSCSRLITTH